MAYDPVITEAKFVTNVTVDASATTFLAGDLLAYNGSAWVKANAATPATLSAVAIAMQTVATGGSSTYSMPVCKEAIITDDDAPFTVGGKLYLSGATAGKMTHTRPTTAAYLRQVVGMALSTSAAHIRIEPLREVSIPLTLMETTSGEAALGSRTALDSGLYEGIITNAQNEYITYLAWLPDNFVSIARAEYRTAQDGAGSPTFLFTVNSVVDAASWDTVTADTSESTKAISTNAAGDPLNVYEFSAALNATNIVRPGACLAIQVKQDDAGTVAVLHFGGNLICNVV